MLTIRELKKILDLGKPVFWMMHDCYPFTGGCHYFLWCDLYTKECRSCDHVGRLRWYDIAHKELKIKQKIFSYPNLHFIGPSQWIVDCALRSSLLGSKDVKVCHNVIDTDLFKPRNMTEMKIKIGLDPNKKTILFSAVSVKSLYKGSKYLIEALRLLPSDKYQCVVLGANADGINTGISTFCLGYVREDEKLAEIYNLADVFIMPSIAESFSLVVAEAMACGVPCVGFNCTAIPGLILHKRNGYIANYLSSKNLAEGVRWICEESDYKSMSKSCVDFIEKTSSYHQVLKVYGVITEAWVNKSSVSDLKKN